MQRILKYVISLVGLIGILTGCGVIDTPPMPTVSQSGQQASTVTPTLMKKFVFDTQVAVDLATEQVQTPPPLPPATFPPSPTPRADTLSVDCGILKNLIPQNCWHSETRAIGIQAGYYIADERQGAIQVITDRVGVYNTIQRVGAIEIKTVSYPYVTVFTGTLEFYFNLETRRWLTPVTLVVADPERLSEADSTIQAHLQSHDYLPMLKADTSITSTAVLTSHVLLISSSVDPTVVHSQFKDATMPIVVWNPTVYDALNLVSSDKERGMVANDSITIAQPSHQLTGGLSGTVQLFTINQRDVLQPPPVTMPYGMPPTTAIRIAYPAVPGRPDPNSFSYFAYEQGAVMADNFVAPAKRVALPWAEDGIPTMQGWQLFDAALTWASTP